MSPRAGHAFSYAAVATSVMSLPSSRNVLGGNFGRGKWGSGAFSPQAIANDYQRGAKRLGRSVRATLGMERPSLFYMKRGGRVSREGLADSGDETLESGEGAPAPFRLSDKAQGPTVRNRKLTDFNVLSDSRRGSPFVTRS